MGTNTDVFVNDKEDHVKVFDLHLERFGSRSDMRLSELSDGMNVVYGPAGSGKGTLIQFLRWMFYGRTDETTLGRVPGPTGLHGRMRVIHNEQEGWLVRHDDVGHVGRLVWEGASGFKGIGVAEGGTMERTLRAVAPGSYDRTFSVDFTKPLDVERLLDSARSHGIELDGSYASQRRIGEIERELHELRTRTYDRQGDHYSLDSLRSRRQQLAAQIDRDLVGHRDRRTALDQEYDDLHRQITELETSLGPLRHRLREKETAIVTRDRMLDETFHEAAKAKDDYLEQRHTQLDTMEVHLGQWRSVLADIRERRRRAEEELQARRHRIPVSDLDHRHVSGCLIRPLADKMEALQRHLDELHGHATLKHGSPYDSHRFDNPQFDVRHGHHRDTSAMSATLQSVREEIAELCQQLRDYRDLDQWHAISDELRELEQCEQAMERLVQSLEQRRARLSEEIAEAERYGLSLVVREQHREWDGTLRNELLPYDIEAVPYASFEYDLVDARTDEWLREMIRERDALAREVDALEFRLRDLVERRRQLECRRQDIPQVVDVEPLRRELHEVELRIAQLSDHEQRAERIRRLEDELAGLRNHYHPSTVMTEASEYLRRMTSGRYRQLDWSLHHDLTVQDVHQSQRVGMQRVGRSTFDQIYLSLCLALITAYRRQHIDLPLVLNDVFVNFDGQRTEETADVLQDFSHQHQVLLFTRHRHVVDMFRARHARCLELDDHLANTHTVSYAVHPARIHETEHDETDRVYFSRIRSRREASRVRNHAARTPSSPARVRPAAVRTVGHVVSELTPISTLGYFDNAVADQLSASGLTTLRSFLESEADAVSRDLQMFEIASSRILHWQRELALRCYAADLSELEARLLVCCGVDDPDSLADSDAEALYERIRKYLDSDPGAEQFRSIGARFDQGLVGSWIQVARQRRTQWTGRPWRSYRQRSSSSSSVRPSAIPGDQGQRESRRTIRRRRVRRQHEPVKRQSSAERSTTVRMEGRGDLRFFLDLNDPLEDAPSIGPKTARMFEEIGVYSVQDFLSQVPEKMAERIDHARINAETVRQWQYQTELACRIPEVRGHDAQILVACGITRVEDLATMTANTLWAKVDSLMQTNEGKRIIRNGNPPDIEEVTNWILWSKSARTLRAA